MNFWDYLRMKSREERQEIACQRVEQWCEEVMEQATAIGELQRRFKRPVGVVE